MGAKKKRDNGGAEDNNNGKKGGDGGGEKKKQDNPVTVVLKIDLHCDGCTSKIVKTLKAFDGVESVKTESGAHKLTVVGKVDPGKLREKLAGKLKKKVDLVSPQPPKKEKEDNGGGNEKKQTEKAVKEDKKPKEAPVTTAVLKLNLHCQGCIEKICKIVTKTKGYHDIEIEKEKDLITLKGAMDMKAVAESIKVRLKRNVEIVPPKKEKGGEKGGEKGKGGGDNDGGGKKKGNEGGGEGGNAGGGKVDKMDFPPVGQMGQMGFGQVPPYGPPVYGYDYATVPMMYMANPLHAPQLFSDENPNACTIM